MGIDPFEFLQQKEPVMDETRTTPLRERMR
jgi:hypothetical protein